MWKHIMNNLSFAVTTVRVIILAVSLSVATGCTNVTQSKSLAGNNNQNNPSSSLEKVAAQTSEQTLKQTSSQYSQKPPFIGKRFFNFAGGNGTGQSIVISADGTTIVQLHGKFENLVLYRGKYTNPIKLQDGSGKSLLLKDDQIYLLTEDGQFSRYCQGEDKPCVSDLLASTSETPEPVQTTNIQDGNYITGIGLGIDPRIGLEVQGNKYRYYDEYEKKEWRSISELKAIKAGLIFDGQEYWCSPPNSEDGVCTKNGWEDNENNP
jgi:hypothetical protein